MGNLEIYLKEFGLSANESKVYLTLLSIGPSTIMQISNASQLNRTTVHLAVEKLLHLGMAITVQKTSRRVVVAEPPEVLKNLIEKEKAALIRKENHMEEIFKEIYKNIHSIKENTAWDVKFLEGKNQVWKLYEQTLKEDAIYSFCNLDKYYETFPNTKSIYDEALALNHNRIVKDILIDTPFARNIKKHSVDRYEVKFLPKNNFFNNFEFGDYMIFNDKVALVQFNDEDTRCILINSRLITLSFIGLHKTMWDLL